MLLLKQNRSTSYNIPNKRRHEAEEAHSHLPNKRPYNGATIVDSWADKANEYEHERGKPTPSPTDARERFPSDNERERDRYDTLITLSPGSVIHYNLAMSCRRERDRERGRDRDRERDRLPPGSAYSQPRPPLPLGATNYSPHDRDRDRERERWMGVPREERYANDRLD